MREANEGTGDYTCCRFTRKAIEIYTYVFVSSLVTAAREVLAGL